MSQESETVQSSLAVSFSSNGKDSSQIRGEKVPSENMNETTKACPARLDKEKSVSSDGAGKNEEAGESEEKKEEAEEEKPYPGGWRLVLSFAALILVLLVGGIDGTILATGVPTITDEFDTTADVGWYLTSFRLAACAMQFPFGKLYKHYPTKYVFMASNSIFMVGSILCAAAVSSPMFIIGRTLTGVGIAGGSAGFFNLIMDVVAPRLRPVLGGIFGAVEMLSGILGPIIGGLIIQHTTWRWCFWINVPICVVALLSMFFFLPYIPKTRENGSKLSWPGLFLEMDMIGIVILTGALVALFLALNWSGVSYEWNSPTIIALFVVCGILLGIFAFHESRIREKGILPPHILQNRNVYSGVVFSLGCVSSLSIVEYYAPVYYQIVHEYTPQESGLLMLPSLVSTLIGLLIQGAGASYLGYYTPFSVAGSILMPVSAGLMTTWGLQTGLARLIIYLAMVGFSTGIGFQGPLNAVQTTLKKEDVPLGIAVVLFAQMFGPAIFVSVAQAIFANSLAADISRLAPQQDASTIAQLGLIQLRAMFSGGELRVLIQAFNEAIRGAWYLALGLTGLTLVGSLLMPWAKISRRE